MSRAGGKARSDDEHIILEYLGPAPPPHERPPPSREVVRMPVDEEGREIQAS